MELIYKVEFNTTNSYFKYIIDQIITQSKKNIICKMYKGFILLLCDDTQENIESFFASLEEKLPLSIYIAKSYIIEDFNFEKNKELEDKKVKQNITLLTNDEIKNILDENHINFSNDINVIKEGKISRFETHNGLKDLFLANKEIREDFESKGFEVKLLITNINKISELLEITQKDLQLLCSIERPLIKLKFKENQNLNAEFSNTRFIYAKISDDKETVLFSQALKEEGIDYVLYVNDEVYQDGLKVTYLEDQNIVVHGDKGLFPKYDYDLKKTLISCKDYFDEYDSVYKAVLSQKNLNEVSSLGVYLSYKSKNSALKVNIPSSGEKDIILIPNVTNDINKCFEEIKKVDENSIKLIENYKSKYAQNFEKEFSSLETYGFDSIFNIIAYILGMKDYIEFEDSALLYEDSECLQIDMRTINIDGKNYLDYRRVIQSIMSYKLAGVENSLLASSVYKSLCDLIIRNIYDINSDIKTKNIVLCGDMFSNFILLKGMKNSLLDFNIILPSEYPLDY